MQWYFLPPIGIQSNINNNILGSTSGENFIKDKLIPDVSVPPLQPYRGDILIEGRWGNSIRFGSTIEFNDTLYTTKPTWTGKTIGDPIIALSNGRKRQVSRPFVIEEPNSDNSSLYLTSTQKFPIQIKGSKNLNESNFSDSQLIGIADRVILKTKKDKLIADSPDSIVLNSPEVKIGSDQANIGIANTDVLIEIINHLINALISGYTAPGGAPCVANGGPEIINAVQKLSNLKSRKYFITKD